jgi:carbon monoxide dehydrogenase subunit G
MVDRPPLGVSAEGGSRRRKPRPVVIEMSETMPGPPDVVWALITDWEHQGDWMLEASNFEVIGNQRQGVGVEARATVRIAGIRTRDTIRVGMWEPPRLLVIDHLGRVKGTGEIQLAPIREGTRIRWRETLFAPKALGPLGRLGLRVAAPLMRRIFRRDLRVLQSLVRLRSADRPGDP